MVARRGPAGGDQDVGALGSVGGLGDRLGLVRRDADLDRLGAPTLNRGGQGDAVGADDLIGARNGAGRDQFVAGRQYGDARPAADGDFAMPRRGQKAQVAGGDRAPGRDQQLAGAEIQPRPADEASLGRGLADDDVFPVLLGVFLDGDDVGALRDHRAGEDADAGARGQPPFEPFAGPRDADLAQSQRHVADVVRAQGVAVHGRDRVGRMVEPGGKVLRGHPAVGHGDRDGLRVERLDRRQDPRARLLHGDQSRIRRPEPGGLG